MIERYIPVYGLAQVDTRKAFCIKNPSYELYGEAIETTGDVWIPKAHIHDDSLDVIDESERNDEVEIFVARWFMKEL